MTGKNSKMAVVIVLGIIFCAALYRVLLRSSIGMDGLAGDDVNFHAISAVLTEHKLFYNYFDHVAYKAMQQRGLIFPLLNAVAGFLGAQYLPTTGFILHIASTVLGLWLAFSLARSLYDERVAITTVALLSFSPLLIYSSCLFNPQTILFSLVMLLIWLGHRAATRPGIFWPFLTGVALCLVFTEKGHGVLLIPGILLLLPAAGSLGGAPKRRRLRTAALLSGVLLAVAACSITTGNILGTDKLKDLYDPRVRQLSDQGVTVMEETYFLIMEGRTPSFLHSSRRMYPPQWLIPDLDSDGDIITWLGVDPQKENHTGAPRPPMEEKTPADRTLGIFVLALLRFFWATVYVKSSLFSVFLFAGVGGIIWAERTLRRQRTSRTTAGTGGKPTAVSSFRAHRYFGLLLMGMMPIYLCNWWLHRHLDVMVILLAFPAAKLVVRASMAIPRLRLGLRERLAVVLLPLLAVGAVQARTVVLMHKEQPWPWDELQREVGSYIRQNSPPQTLVLAEDALTAAYARRFWIEDLWKRRQIVCECGTDRLFDAVAYWCNPMIRCVTWPEDDWSFWDTICQSPTAHEKERYPIRILERGPGSSEEPPTDVKKCLSFGRFKVLKVFHSQSHSWYLLGNK